MENREDIQILLEITHRRLQKLRERKAQMGLNTPIHILTEIEDTEAEIEKLQAELKELENRVKLPSQRITHTTSKRNLFKWIGLGGLILILLVSGATFFINRDGQDINISGITSTFPPISSPATTPIFTIVNPVSEEDTSTTPTPSPTITPTETPKPSTPTKTPTEIPQSATATPTQVPTKTSAPVYEPTTPSIITNCPEWFATPEPGKAVLVLENHFYQNVNVSYYYDLHQNESDTWVIDEWDKFRVSAKQDDEPGRRVLQIRPGHLLVGISSLGGVEPSFSFGIYKNRDDLKFIIQAGQILGFPLFDFVEANVPEPVPYPLEIPAGCPYP